MTNVKDVDLARHAWDTPPFLLIVSPTPPVQSVDAYVRTLGQSRDNQTKRLTIIYEYGAVSHAREARVGAPLLTWQAAQLSILAAFQNIEIFSSN